MEIVPEPWEVRHTRSNSVQPPWECESPASVSSAVDAQLATPPSRSSTSNGGYESFLENGSVPSPLEALYRRTASFSDSSPTARQDNGFPLRSSFLPGIGPDGVRRQSLSGPLPVQRATPEDYSSMGYFRRPLSGPLPLPSHNPYSLSFDPSATVGQNAEAIPPLRTPPPWSEIHMKETSGTTNPYLNPNMFSPSGSLSVSSSSLSPSSLPRPPAHANGNAYSGSSPVLSPNSVPGTTSNFQLPGSSPRGGAAPVRQLYGCTSPDPLASLNALPSPSVGSRASPATSSSYEQWASYNGVSQRSPDVKASLSQRTHHPLSASSSSRAPVDSNFLTVSGKAVVNRGLTRSRSAHNGVFTQNGGALPFNSKGELHRSLSHNGVDALVSKYSKGKGGVGEGVLETLVSQLVVAHERPCMLADMIFCPAKLSGSARNSKGPFAYARDLVERILLAQVHALTPNFKDIAQQKGVFEKHTWVLNPLKSGQVHENFPNEGFRFLRLQNQFVEAGLATFDVLCRVRKQFPSLMADEGGACAGLLRIACLGGGPGCEALAMRLFYMRIFPSLELQVDMFDRNERWKAIVENISLKGVGIVNADLFDAVFHPTWLRSYRLLMFLDILGESMKARHGDRQQDWDGFWHQLHRNTAPGVVVIIHDKSCPWETMKPKKGSQWWCSALAEQEKVHVARKV